MASYLTLGPLQQLGGDQALDPPVHLLEVEQQAVTVPLPLLVQVISAVSSLTIKKSVSVCHVM